jgi:hypothetical protein
MLKLAPTGSIQFDLVDPPRWSKVANLSYCLQNAASERYVKFNCTYLDGIQTRIIQGDSILVTTRVTGTVQQRQPCEEDCDDLWSPPLANDTTANNDNTYFTAEPENHKLRILHSVQQTTFGISKESRDMFGFLFVGKHAHNGKVDDKPTDAQNTLCRTHPNAFKTPSLSSPKATGAPCYIRPTETDGNMADEYTIDTLLTAASTDLDSSTDLDMSPSNR